MQTNFQKVVDFNRNFGVLDSTDFKSKLDIFDKDPKQVEFCMKLIREEMSELENAVKTKDYIEMIDALADLTYVIFGMSARVGADMDKAFSIVHDNNMSKLCKTEDEAQRTVKYYVDNMEKMGYDSPAYRKAPDDIHWVVFNESTKKILKSIEWKPVDLSYLLK